MIMRAKNPADEPITDYADNADGAGEPLELTPDLALGFDAQEWQAAEREQRGAGGRAVLGWALAVAAAAWLGWTGWSAGRSLAGQSLDSPMVVQWVAIAAAPLALLALAWLVFGRTRRKEAEAFTRSVVAMRSEARSLEALLDVLSQRLTDSQSSMKDMAERLMTLGDETTGRFDGITRSLDDSARALAGHGDNLDRAAESARNDIGVLLADLPRAEESARLLAERLRTIGSDSSARSTQLRVDIDTLANQAREADDAIGASSQRLAAQLESIRAAGDGASERVAAAEAGLSGALDALLERTSSVLDQVRAGIDVQAQAVNALVEQAEAGMTRSGAESAAALAANAERADAAMERIASRLAEQEMASRQMVADIDGGLAQIDSRVALLAEQGDERAGRFLAALGETRAALDSIFQQAGTQDDVFAGMLDRSGAIRAEVDRLAEVAASLSPEIAAMHDVAAQTNVHVNRTGTELAGQRQQVENLLAAIRDGAGEAQSTLITLTRTIGQTRAEAQSLAEQTGPALVQALLQVREGAAQAATRAREAIDAVIPASAAKLSEEARTLLARTVEDVVVSQMREVEAVATRAVEAARGASDRLTQQMLSLGQSASALEAHLGESSEAQREKDSEAFARRVSLLMDSMNSAAIDVGKILSVEVDDRAWDNYLRGDRGVFTRRAVRLIDNNEARALRAHYDSDGEFQQSANRYVHDFEAMLRRVLAERDGGIIAVTLMSSDMGKLYAAIAQVIDRRR